MEFTFIEAPANAPIPRIYVASMLLAEFKGRRNVEAHIFRHSWAPEELEELAALDLVGPPDPGMPAQLVEGATREAALKCVLEAFTKEEIQKLAAHLKERHGAQILSLRAAPLQLPAPLGVGPLGELPTGAESGFIKLDKAPGYDLPFLAWAYYELPNS